MTGANDCLDDGNVAYDIVTAAAVSEDGDYSGMNADDVSVTNTDDDPISLSESHVDVTCNGGVDGSINLSVSGGTAPYTYLWDNAATTQDISGLPAGTYTVTVTDANSCTAQLPVTISEPSVLSLSESHIDVTCNGGVDGSINLSVSGGTAPYTYLWDNAATTQDISSLAAGTYTVTVTDANSCTAQLPVTISEPSALSLTESHVDVTCNGGVDGSINLSVSEGTTPYTYLWDNAATTQDISSLAAGTYTVTVTDANSCTAQLPVTISEPSALSLSESHADVTCNGGVDGSINLSVSGGTAPYTYLWSHGETAQDISGLAAGTYTVTVTDANSCTAQLPVTISEPSALSLSESHADVTCNGGVDGSINLSVSGGTAPYTYLWDNAATTQDISSLGAGIYIVNVTDANSCTAQLSVTISEPAVLSLSESHIDVTCNGLSNGSIDLSVSGGTTPYTYSWDTNPDSTTQDLSGLAAGTYTVTVTDANSCTAQLPVTISEPAVLTLSESHVDVTCNGGSNGSIDLSVSGGTTPYTYSWDTNPDSTTQDLSGLAAGTYTVTVTDANSCTAQLSVTIGEPTEIVLIESHVDVTCNGGSDGSIDLSVSGGKAPYTYSWDTNPVSTTQDLAGLSAGTYTVTVTDANSCKVQLPVTISDGGGCAPLSLIVVPAGDQGGDSILHRVLPVEQGENPPMIGLRPLAAIYEVGELITGSCAITDAEGTPLSASWIHLYVYSVDLSTDPELVMLLDHWTVRYDRVAERYQLEVATELLLPGYYDIHLSFADGSTQTMRIQLVEPVE